VPLHSAVPVTLLTSVHFRIWHETAITSRADDVGSWGWHRDYDGRHPMPADLASRMTLALAGAGESRLDRYPTISGVLSLSPLDRYSMPAGSRRCLMTGPSAWATCRRTPTSNG
jgi:hypothetical protein